MNTTKYNYVQDLKLKTIEQNHDEEQPTLQRIVTTSPIQIKAKKNQQANTLEKQYEISRMGKKTKLFANDTTNKETIDHSSGKNTRHRRNKTEVNVKHKGKQKDPVYNCLYVPFLQTKMFEMGKKSVKKIKTQYPISTQKQKANQHSQLKSQRSFSQPNSKTENLQKVLTLPEIKKNTQPILKHNIQNLEIGRQRVSAPKITGAQTFTSSNKFINPSRLSQLKNPSRIERQKTQQNNNKQQKNLKQFKLKNKQDKIKSKKTTKKVQQWKQINFLQLKTCYYQIQKRMATDSVQESIKDHSTLNVSSKLSSSGKNLKKDILMHQRTPKVPKFPSSTDQVSLIIKDYHSIRKNKISIDNLIKSKNFKVKFVDKTMLYFGQMVNEIFDGYGVLIKNDEMFQGVWEQGKKITGTQFKKGIYYQGSYINGKKQGFGISYWNQGFDQYSGEWKNGLKSGNGVWKNLDGDQYIGQWINGKVEGYGVHTTVDGQKYEGYFINFLKHGKGKQMFPNGDHFEGNFAEGKPDGQGVYKFNRGKVVYEGNFSKGLRMGKGKLVVPSLLVYEGQFENDTVYGYGKINYLNDDSYLGHFRDGLRHGQGTFHNVKQNIILTGLWSKGNFFSNSQQQNISNLQKK